MREFEYLFDEGLSNGLVPSSHRTKGQGLIECYNLKAGQYGLEGYDPVVLPEAMKLPLNHNRGWPRIFNSPRLSALVTNATPAYHYLYNINRDTYATTLQYSSAVNTEIDIATFGMYTVVVLTNGFSLIQGTGTGLVPPDLGLEIPNSRSCCNFREQFVCTIGGWVQWSEIGHISMAIDRKNTAGNIYIPTYGDGGIVMVKALHDHIVCFAFDSIWALTPVVSPAPTFRLTRLTDVGINGLLAADGNEDMLVGVLTTGELIEIDSSLKVTRREFSEYLPDDAVVTYNQFMNEWHIVGDDEAYLWTRYGLNKVYQAVTGVLPEESVGVGETVGRKHAQLMTNKFDFGYKGIKTITGIEVSGEYEKGEVSVKYKTNGTWYESKPVSLNRQGTVGAPVSGEKFQVKVKFNNYLNVELDWIKVRWKMSDLRHLRGVYSPPPRGQYAS